MDETTVNIIGMIIAIVIMLIVPLTLIADRADDIAQLSVSTTTAQFVDDVIKTGQITDARYQGFISSLHTSGNTYEIDLEVQILDENISQRVTVNNPYEIGNNKYYSIFTSQIEEKIGGRK